MSKKVLSPEQYVAIEWLALPNYGGKTLQEIADLCGVHHNTLYNWRKEDYFNRAVVKSMVKNTQHMIPDALNSLGYWGTEKGNAQMLKMLLTAHGVLKEEIEVTTNDKTKDDITDIQAMIDQYKNDK